jgi:chromosome partitioning protein
MSIIAVFNQKGGVGRTTTAFNLLAAIASRGQRPLGIDLDPQAHLSQAFGAHPKSADDSVYSFFARQRPLADVAQITRSGVVLCPAHVELAKLDALLSKGIDHVTRLRQALHQADAATGPVIIDTGRLFNVLTLNALFACDLLLVPVTCDFLALRAARDVERSLNALEPVVKQRLPRRYLLTRYDARRKMSLRVAEQMASALHAEEICATRIRESEPLAESLVIGLDVFRHASNSRGARDYQALADELTSAGFIT